MYLSVQNLLNRVDNSHLSVSRPRHLMKATSAQAARRVELGWRYSF